MTLRIELTPETEAKLRNQAAAAGKDMETVAREAIEDTLAVQEELDSRQASLTIERRVAELRAWAASHRKLDYIADDSRESIYEGCGE
jgi:predicted DNA-binding protein